MKNRRNYYRLLQVQADAPPEVIRSSYRTLMRELKQHPDLGGSTFNASLLNEAYAVLSDANRRASYDRELFNCYTKRMVPGESPGKLPLETYFCTVCKRPLARKPQPGDRCLFCKSNSRLAEAKRTKPGGQRTNARIASDKQLLHYFVRPGEAREGQMVNFSQKGLKSICT